MYNTYVSCPLCGEEINEKNNFANNIICSCGWNVSLNKSKNNKQAEQKIVKKILLTSFVIALVISFSIYLGTDQGKIGLLKTKSLLNLNSQKDSLNLSKLCLKYKNISCAVNTLMEVYTKNPKQIDLLKKIAQIHINNKKYDNAEELLKKYLELGGKDVYASYQYGKVLELLDKNEEAIDQYRKSMTWENDFININSTQALIALLIKLEKYKEAKKTINFFYKKTKRNDFKKEFALINKALKRKI